MCRVFGLVSHEPTSVSHELLHAENPMIRQSEHHDSGWGMAVYERAEGGEPALVRFPEAAHGGEGFAAATEKHGRIFNVHVRRATLGGLTLENTHPFCLGSPTPNACWATSSWNERRATRSRSRSTCADLSAGPAPPSVPPAWLHR